MLLVSALLSFAGCFGGGSYSPVRTAFNRGVHLASVGELEAAVSEYRDALRIDAEDYRARFNLASTLEDLADRDEANDNVQRASERRQAARAQYETLLRRKPGELRASINLALREHADSERESAFVRLTATAEAHPRDPRPWARSPVIFSMCSVHGAVFPCLYTLSRKNSPTARLP